MDCRKIEISLPAARGGASKDHLRDVFLVDEFRYGVGHALSLQPRHRRANGFGEANVRGQRSLIGFARVLPQVGVDDKELGIHRLGHARPARHQILRRWVRTDADRDAFADGNRRSIVRLPFAVLFQAQIHLLGHLAQGQLTQSDQVGLAEEIFERPSHALLRVDVAAPHAVLQRLRSQVDHHYFVDSLQYPVGNGLPYLDPGDSLHRRGYALQVLDIHGGKNVDPRVQQLQHIFVALAMFAALDIGVRQFVHQSDPRVPRENGVDVHLFEERALVLDRFARYCFQIRDQVTHRFAAVSFDYYDHHIFAAGVPADRLGQHGVGLAHAGSISEKELEQASLLRRRTLFQPLLGSLGHRAYCR